FFVETVGVVTIGDEDHPGPIGRPDSIGLAGGTECQARDRGARDIDEPEVSKTLLEIELFHDDALALGRKTRAHIETAPHGRADAFSLTIEPGELARWDAGSWTGAIGKNAIVGGGDRVPAVERVVRHFVGDPDGFAGQPQAIRIESLGHESPLAEEEQKPR